MSHQEKSNFISLITTLVVTVPYLIHVFGKYQSETLSSADELSFWASALLLLIPIRIVAEIIMYILASIVTAVVTNKEDSELTDERDKLIDLKSTRNSYYLFITGMMMAMIAAAITKSASDMFIILILAGFLAEVCGVISQIYYYRREA